MMALLSIISNNEELVLEPDVLDSSNTPLTKLAETPPKQKEHQLSKVRQRKVFESNSMLFDVEGREKKKTLRYCVALNMV